MRLLHPLLAPGTPHPERWPGNWQAAGRRWHDPARPPVLLVILRPALPYLLAALAVLGVLA